MFGKLLKAAAGIGSDVASVAVAPVAIAASVAREITKPVADAARDTVEAVTPPPADDEE